VLRSIGHVVESGHAAGRWVGVCGEMAGDPRTAVLLAGLGVDDLSVSCFDMPSVKAAIRSIGDAFARGLAAEALALPSAESIRGLLAKSLDPELPAWLLGHRSDA
jgi:phosphoenolpyruvate-protein kinase (PTS system EI component)